MNNDDRPLDHGELNVPLEQRYGRGGIDAALDRYAAAHRRKARRENRAKVLRRKAEREKDAQRPRFTRSRVVGSTHVRDQFGWHRVVRVNSKTVTVETKHSWNERIPFDRVFAVRTVGDPQ